MEKQTSKTEEEIIKTSFISSVQHKQGRRVNTGAYKGSRLSLSLSTLN